LFFFPVFVYSANPNVGWCAESMGMFYIMSEGARNDCIDIYHGTFTSGLHEEVVDGVRYYCVWNGVCYNPVFAADYVASRLVSICCDSYPPRHSKPASQVRVSCPDAYSVQYGYDYCKMFGNELDYCGAEIDFENNETCGVFDITPDNSSSSMGEEESSSSASDGGVSSSSGGASSGSQGMSSGDGGVSSDGGGGRSSDGGVGGSSSAGCVWYYTCMIFGGNYGNSACLPTRPSPNNSNSHLYYLYKQSSNDDGSNDCHYTTRAFAISDFLNFGFDDWESYVRSNCSYQGISIIYGSSHRDSSLIMDVCFSDVSFSSSSSASYSSNSSKDYWCDLHPDDEVCKVAGYDEYCDSPEHYDEAYCEWSRDCSRNPHMEGCVNPRPPGGGGNSGGSSGSGGGGVPGGGGSGGGSAGSGGGDDDGGEGSISCKSLSNCDWAKLTEQMKQLGVEQASLDSLSVLVGLVRAGYGLQGSQLDWIKSLLSDVYSRLSSIEGTIGNVGDHVAYMGGNVESIRDFSQTIAHVLNGLHGDVREGNETGVSILGYLGGTLTGMLNGLMGTVSGVGTWGTNVLGGKLDDVGGKLDVIGDGIDGLGGKLDGIAGALGEGEGGVGEGGEGYGVDCDPRASDCGVGDFDADTVWGIGRGDYDDWRGEAGLTDGSVRRSVDSLLLL
jgi:hypothetical protein